MTKVNLLKALEQAELDSVPPFEVRCNRGQRFSRYRKHGIETPSDYWAHKYFQSGGVVDSAGVWGYTPQDLTRFEKYRIDPERLGELVKLHGRVDFDGEYILDMVDQGLRPRTIQEFHRNARGMRRKKEVNRLGIESNLGVISLGWMSDEKFVEFVGKRLTKCSHEAVKFFADNMVGTGRIDDRPAFSKPARKAMADYSKWHTRYIQVTPTFRNYWYKTKYALISHIVEGKSPIKFWDGRFSHLLEFQTSVGKIAYGQYCGIDLSRQGILFHDSEKVFKKEQPDMYIARRIENAWIVKIKEITFAWADSFEDHIEGTSVKDALEKLQKRIKKDSLVLTLNDVRNDRTGTAGYCLIGTKEFAQHRMPFLYRLIAPYWKWADVPEDIMATEFSLASKDIFSGYRNPVA